MSKKEKDKKNIVSAPDAQPTKKEIKKAKKLKKKTDKQDKKNQKKIEKLAKKISKKDGISLEDARGIAEPMILTPVVEEEVTQENTREPKSLNETIVICVAVVLCVAIAMFTISYSFGKVTDAKYSAMNQEQTVEAQDA